MATSEQADDIRVTGQFFTLSGVGTGAIIPLRCQRGISAVDVLVVITSVVNVVEVVISVLVVVNVTETSTTVIVGDGDWL